MNDRFALARAILPLCILAAALSSCRLLHERAHPAALEPRAESPSAALAANARFVLPDDDVPTFFKTTLADSGFTAVQVVLRNTGERDLWIHSGNGMNLRPGFAGMRLVCGADTLDPVHPARVATVLMGAKRAGRFRRPGAFGVVMSPILPPLGVYTIYAEVTTGRFYRPLFGKSLYPALQSGLFEPIRLAPGAERTGWLFFDVAPSRRGGACELLVSACVPPRETPGKLSGYAFLFSRAALAPGGSLAGSPGAIAAGGDGYLFSLAAEKKASVLCRWRVDDLARDPVPPPERITTFSTKGAHLADADHAGDRGAVAVNFKSKSRAIALAGAASPSIAFERSFSRPIRRVFTLGERTCAITENGALFLFDERSRSSGNGTSLARGFYEAAFVGDTLLAFSRERGLDVYAVEPDRVEVSSRGRFAVPRGERLVAGASEGALVIVHRGKRIAADTLVYFHSAARAEMRRGALPGRVLRISCDASSVVLQLEDGTLLRLATGPLGSLRIDEAGYLPFKAAALKALPDRFVAIGPDGSVAAGAVGEFRPGRGGAYETAIPMR